MSFFSCAYSSGLTLWALATLLRGKKRRRLKGRLRPAPLPTVRPGCIWVHAVSLGETRAIVPLVQRLQKLWPDKDWVISNTTEAGYAEAQRALPTAAAHLILPIDWKSNMERLMRQARPSLVLLAESDIWFHFLQAARRQGARVALINGKISDTSFRRHGQAPCISRRLLSQIDLYCLQVPLYQQRFEKLGVRPERIRVTGNIKWEGSYPRLSPDERLQWSQRLGLQPGQPCLVAGSTHHPEEEHLLNALRSHPNLKLILAPRHSDRFDQVAQLVQAHGFRLGRWTHGAAPDSQVVLLDAVGLLRTCYQLADLAFVGGTFTPHVGGHNLLEPLGYGVPVLFGPYTWSQPGMKEMIFETQSGLQITTDQLEPTIATLLQDTSKRHQMGQSALDMMERCRGSLEATTAALQTFLKTHLPTFSPDSSR
jgi:3-deoxy-D-manno-octulosonic-acid transferase